jgi:hypothetical protein
MIETCAIPGCLGARVARSTYCNEHHNTAHGLTANPPAPESERHGRRHADIRDGESSGGDVDYYRLHVTDPKRTEPYIAEAEDIIEHLNMTFAEGNAFKAIWRKAAQRTLGHMRRGSDYYGVRDSQKVEYYGKRMLTMANREARKETAGDVRAHKIDELQK